MVGRATGRERDVGGDARNRDGRRRPISGVATVAAVVVTGKVAPTQKQLAQRQLLLPLRDHLSNLSNVRPAEPITPDVIKIVDTSPLRRFGVQP